MVVGLVVFRKWGDAAVGFHVLSEGAGVGVTLVTAPEFAEVRLVASMNMAVLLAVGTVGEPAVTSGKLTWKWFLSCKESKMSISKIL